MHDWIATHQGLLGIIGLAMVPIVLGFLVWWGKRFPEDDEDKKVW